jgi:hypothetical protein
MNKAIKQIQEENRKIIIMACNPTAKSYEKALEMEEKICLANTIFEQGNSVYREYIHPCNVYQNIGKPLTLNRVLIATQNKFFASLMSKKEFMLYIEYNKGIDDPMWIEWDLTKETLEEQAEKTQRAINELLNNE